MERLAKIILSNSILLIPERILWKYLPASEIKTGMARGKIYTITQKIKNKRTERKENV